MAAVIVLLFLLAAGVFLDPLVLLQATLAEGVLVVAAVAVLQILDQLLQLLYLGGESHN